MAILRSGIVFAQSPDVPKVIGAWRVQMDGRPVFALVVTDENRSLSGAVLFYLLKRDVNHPYRTTPGLAEPIFNPKFDGKTLSFQVNHRPAHPPHTLSDPPVTFELTPAEGGNAQLVNKSEGTVIHSGY